MNSYLAITVAHGYIPQILLAETLFTYRLSKRTHFYSRLIIGLIVVLPLMVVVPNWINNHWSGLFSLTVFLLSLILWWTCLLQSFKDILFCCVSAQLVQNLSYNLEQALYQPFAQHFNAVGSLALSITCTCLTYGLTYLVIAKRSGPHPTAEINDTYVYSFALITAVFVYLMQYQYQITGIGNYCVSHLPLMLCCGAGLCVQYGFVALKTASGERIALERLMRQEAKQYELTKQNIDLINMKAHDLKHQLLRIQEGLGEDKDDLSEISSILDSYDNSPHTGNKELDLILSQKEMLCRQDEIVFSIMVQPDSLSRLDPGDIASIFGNLLDNAIEYERKVSDHTQRYIGLKIRTIDGLIGVRVENYCRSKPIMSNGLPVSTKDDRKNHGFGLRSVVYTTNKYKGTLHLGMEGDLFVASLLL